MKPLLFLFILLNVSSYRTFSQDSLSFSYDCNDKRCIVKPKFESFVIKEKKQARFYAIEIDYYRETFYNCVKKALPDKFNALSIENRSWISFFINSAGQIVYVDFRISASDRNVLSDKDLLSLHQAVKQMNLDMDKIGYEPAKPSEADDLLFGQMAIQMIPKGFENRP